MFSASTPQPARRRAASRQTLSQATSRQSSPASPPTPPNRHGRVAARFATATDAMAVDTVGADAEDMREGTVLIHAEDYRVSVVGNLPAELKEILRLANLQTEVLQGMIDEQTGYAYILSFSRCYVWNFAHRSLVSPAPYAFPVAPSQSKSPAHAAFVPHPTREPGVLVCSPEGQVRYWDSVARGLIDPEKFLHMKVVLSDGEELNGVWGLETGLFVVSTTYGHLFRVSLTTNQAGQQTLLSSAFSSSRGVMSRMASTLFRSGVPVLSLSSDSLKVMGLAVGIDQGKGKEVWVAKPAGVEMWRIDRAGGEQLVVSQNVQELLIDPIQHQTSYRNVDVRMLDVAYLQDSSIGILVSFHVPSAVTLFRSPSSDQLRSYGIALLELDGAAFRVANFKVLRFRSSNDYMQNSFVRLVIVHRGTAAFIQFPDTVVLTTLLPGVTFEEIVPLKDAKHNQYLGYGSSPSVGGADSNAVGDEVCRLTFLTAMSGLLEFEMSITRIHRQITDMTDEGSRYNLATKKLEATLEQAVFYGDSFDNPLSFDMGADVEGNLSEAVERVSERILSSSSSHMQPIIDLRAQLVDRQKRVEILIKYINRNHMLDKLPVSNRWILYSDAQKLAVAGELWADYDKRSDQTNGGRPVSVLSEAVEMYMRGARVALGGDVVRSFFRSKIRDLGAVIELFAPVTQRALDSQQTIKRQVNVVLDANSTVQVINDSAKHFHEAFHRSYDLQSPPPIPPWTSEPPFIKVVQFLFETTLRLYEALSQIKSREDPEMKPDDVTRYMGQCTEQLSALAKMYFSRVRERLSYLRRQVEEGADDRELKDLDAEHLLFRPTVMSGLVTGHLTRQAFLHAEEERDWRSLIELCHRKDVGSQVAVEWYIEHYKDAFSFELYHWYIEKGMLHELLRQDEQHSAVLDRFLEGNKQPRISWIHHLWMKEFRPSAQALYSAADREPKVAEKKVMLSIGKLCELAQFDLPDLQSEGGLKTLEAVDFKLDLISVHETLRLSLEDQTRLPPSMDAEEAATDVAGLLATRIQDSPPYLHLFKRFVKQLWQGRVLSPEDLIDLVTWKDKYEDKTDYGTALNIFVRTGANLPESRALHALQAIWRRVFLHDWFAPNPDELMTDARIEARFRSTALYRTLQSAREEQVPTKYILRPSQCVTVPAVGELAARFGEFNTVQLEELRAVLLQESSKVRQLIDIGTGMEIDGENLGLDQLYLEVTRLVDSDLGTSMEE